MALRPRARALVLAALVLACGGEITESQPGSSSESSSGDATVGTTLTTSVSTVADTSGESSSSTTTSDPGTETGPDSCGDGVIDPGEDCEGGDLHGQTCVTQGFGGGPLTCTRECTFDTIGCFDIACGDGRCVEGENACNCQLDCIDDPNTCSTCECGGNGGSCACDEGCFAAGNCCANVCDENACGTMLDGCAQPECGDGECNGTEDPCSCEADCPDDPDTCSACECGGSGGNCFCDDACVDNGDCCANVCDVGVCDDNTACIVCGDAVCEGDEDACSCPADCVDDPDTCSTCECGGSGGNCMCDEACMGAGTCCVNLCDANACGEGLDACATGICGDGLCDTSEDAAGCPEDCPDDPDGCSALECGGFGGDCYCDELCFGFGDCCADVCEADACHDVLAGCVMCGDAVCEGVEDSCGCPADCADDPDTCSVCECGGPGGNCMCDESCVVDGDCCTNACTNLGCGDLDACVTGVCGDGLCDNSEDSCGCPEDCPDDPGTCSACECGGFGGGCYCDEDCFDFGDCCGNICDVGSCDDLMGCQ